MQQKLKNKIFIVFLLLVLTGCQSKERIPTVGLPTTVTEVNLRPGISIRCKQEIQDNSIQKLECIIQNDTEHKYSPQCHYALEYEQDGQWYCMNRSPSDKTFIEPELAWICHPYSEMDHTFWLEAYGTYFPSGHYRVIVTNGSWTDEETGLKYYHSDDMLSCEFYIE